MSKWIGYAVSVNCGEPLGCYQGTILDADGTTITLAKAFRNGFPYPKSQVTLNAADIKDLKIIETKAPTSEQTHSTVAVTKTSKKTAKTTVCENLQANPSSSDYISGNQSQHGIAGSKAGSSRNAPQQQRSKPIDIQGQRNNKNNNNSGSYGHSGSTPKGRGAGGAAPGDKARRRNEACFGSAADPGIDRDFDFEGNLALFDKRRLWEQMNSQKPDLVRQADDAGKVNRLFYTFTSHSPPLDTFQQPLQYTAGHISTATTVHRWAHFNSTTVHRWTHFNSTTVHRWTHFNSTTVHRWTHFNSTKVQRWTHFNNTIVHCWTHFNSTTVHRWTHFNSPYSPPLDTFQQHYSPPLDTFQQHYSPPLDTFQQHYSPPLDTFQQPLQSITGHISTALQSTAGHISTALQSTAGHISTATTVHYWTHFNSHYSPLLDTFQQHYSPPLDTFQQPLQSITGHISTALQSITGHISTVLQSITGHISTALQSTAGHISTAPTVHYWTHFNSTTVHCWTHFNSPYSPLLDTFQQHYSPPLDTFQQPLQSITGHISTALQSITGHISTVLQSITGHISTALQSTAGHISTAPTVHYWTHFNSTTVHYWTHFNSTTVHYWTHFNSTTVHRWTHFNSPYSPLLDTFQQHYSPLLDTFQQPLQSTAGHISTATTFRHDENVLGGSVTASAATRRAIRVPDALRGLLDYVTDEGVCVPSVLTAARRRLWEALARAGLAGGARVLLARAAADVCVRLVGGGRRLEPRNAHQAPTVAVLCGAHKTGAAALTAARLLSSHNCNVVCYTHPTAEAGGVESGGEELQRELSALVLSNIPVVASLDRLPASVDLVLVAIHDLQDHSPPDHYSPCVQWARSARAAAVALEPPEQGWECADGGGALLCRASVCALLPGALPPALGRVYLADVAPPNTIFQELRVHYKPPFGAACLLALHPADADD
ncbi:hypothetical protein O0L34_g7981 [Tuta absoluta]|nr:hypothetical protein O0L34_g7981 [Tuta absoluta]